ncbi:Per1-domain-containing protein [Suhomyces tanzawaensis NRRL Y-17324]|uniref:Post-GPI attachment to proteins factor 3 n=1 Tax=Suhomyces tanzawaensis NRRL Y-17324 TaxID=984487 RepID=A0A1E4SI38_9ASCO|nr:Per1-domain-containing protein [Suhomyces tanzawaensis NRRL Y-17324]ODV79165.1 Per1-domain-containing protein [Suhomyces tanzawaensis NRRL Y-17324]
MRPNSAVIAFASLYGLANASYGDTLPEFQTCLKECILIMHCRYRNIFQEIEASREEVYKREQEIEPRLSQRQIEIDYFTLKHQLSAISAIFWNCEDDCSYKCQQLITEQRKASGLPMVQFFGKWPFTRVFGIQEIFLVIFSFGNFYANYINLFKVLHQYNKNRKDPHDTYHLMYLQYVYFIIIALCGWSASILFHIRDNRITETLDYYGAFAIVLSNFNCVSVRYFELFKKPKQLVIWQVVMVMIYVGHCIKLKLNWNYGYNAKINLLYGFGSIVLWVAHSLKVNRKYKENFFLYNNSMQILPFETKILTKLNMLSVSQTRLIPLIPIFLNVWMMIGMSFEACDFEPVYQLIDAHSIWHIFTIFPTIIWFDWNIWDIELSKVGELNKIS